MNHPNVKPLMSLMGQKATSSHRRDMSVLLPAADMPVNGSFAPEAVIPALRFWITFAFLTFTPGRRLRR
jgi:hypothetical protein